MANATYEFGELPSPFDIYATEVSLAVTSPNCSDSVSSEVLASLTTSTYADDFRPESLLTELPSRNKTSSVSSPSLLAQDIKQSNVVASSGAKNMPALSTAGEPVLKPTSVWSSTDIATPFSDLSENDSSDPQNYSRNVQSLSLTASSLSSSSLSLFLAEPVSSLSILASSSSLSTLSSSVSSSSSSISSSLRSCSSASLSSTILAASNTSTSLLQSPQVSSSSSSSCMSPSIQLEVEKATRRLELEKRKLEVLEDSLQRLRGEYDDKRVRYANASKNDARGRDTDGTDFAAPKHKVSSENKINTMEVKKAESKVQIMKKRLEKDLSKLNVYMHDRTRIVEGINQLRRERISLSKASKRLSSEIQSVEEEFRLLSENMVAKGISETNLLSKITAIKEQRTHERKDFKEKVCKLQILIDQQNGILKNKLSPTTASTSNYGNINCGTTDGHMIPTNTKVIQTTTATGNVATGIGSCNPAGFNSIAIMKTILKTAFLNSIKRRQYRVHQQTILTYTKAEDTIKSATGIENIDQIVDIFQTLEEKNYSLITFINDATNELHAMKKKRACFDTTPNDAYRPGIDVDDKNHEYSCDGGCDFQKRGNSIKKQKSPFTSLQSWLTEALPCNEKVLTECLGYIRYAYKDALRLVDAASIRIPIEATSLSLLMKLPSNKSSGSSSDPSTITSSKDTVPHTQIDSIIPLLASLERIILSCGLALPNRTDFMIESSHCLGFPTPAYAVPPIKDVSIHHPTEIGDEDDDEMSERPLTLAELKARAIKHLHKSNIDKINSTHQ